MYLSSDTPILEDQRECRVRDAQRASVCRDQAQAWAVNGRVQLYNTLVDPNDLAAQFGPGLGTSAALGDKWTQVARASAVSTGDMPDAPGPTWAQVIADAPQIGDGSDCQTRALQPRLEGPSPRPGMPQRAPRIVNTPKGPLHFKGELSTIDPTYRLSGLTGYAPPWSDAFVQASGNISGQNDMGVVSWIQAHPWLSLFVAAGGALALSRGGRR